MILGSLPLLLLSRAGPTGWTLGIGLGIGIDAAGTAGILFYRPAGRACRIPSRRFFQNPSPETPVPSWLAEYIYIYRRRGQQTDRPGQDHRAHAEYISHPAKGVVVQSVSRRDRRDSFGLRHHSFWGGVRALIASSVSRNRSGVRSMVGWPNSLLSLTTLPCLPPGCVLYCTRNV